MEKLTSVTTDLICEVDGVYGNVSPPWCSYSHVLFVGGGVGVTPWLPAMEQHQELLHRLHGDEISTTQTMKLVWIGRDFADLKGMGPYLPAEDTTVFLTRTHAATPVVVSPAASDAPSEPLMSLEDSCEMLPQRDQGERATMTVPEQDAVRRSEARPLLFAFVGVVSLCLTQMSYYYLRGSQSVYVDYEQGCGEWCFEGEPTQTQYLLVKVLAVVCSFIAIAGTSIFARGFSNNCWATLKCPCVASGASTVAGGGKANVAARAEDRCNFIALKPVRLKVSYGTPPKSCRTPSIPSPHDTQCCPVL
jgi:hypothetical protein